MNNLYKKIIYGKRGYTIGKNVFLGKGVCIEGKNVYIGDNTYIGNNVHIKAKDIYLGENVIIFDNVDVFINETFSLGCRSKISRNVKIRGNNVISGNDLWCNEEVDIGGGGWKKETANLYIGDYVHIGRKTTINICQEVTIGNKTGIGMEVMILTHSSGHGQSVLEGYEHFERPIHIGNNVSIYTRAFVTPGTNIMDGVVLGALAYARGRLDEKCLYLGVPAIKVKKFNKLLPEAQYKKIKKIILDELNVKYSIVGNTEVFDMQDNLYNGFMIVLWQGDESFAHEYNHNYSQYSLCILKLSENPFTENKSCEFDFIKLTISGETTALSEKMRDVFRRYGIVFDRNEYQPSLLSARELKKKGVEI